MSCKQLILPLAFSIGCGASTASNKIETGDIAAKGGAKVTMTKIDQDSKSKGGDPAKQAGSNNDANAGIK